VLGIVSVALTLYVQDLQLEVSDDDGDVNPLSWLLTIVPALSTLVVTLSSRFNFSGRWANTLAAMQCLEAEIFRFRTKSGSYSLALASTSEPQAYQRPKERGAKEEECRSMFESKVRSLHKSSVAEMGVGMLHRTECQQEKSASWRSKWWPNPPYGSQRPYPLVSEGMLGKDTLDTRCGPMHIDSYITDRTMRVLPALEAEAARLVYLARFVEIATGVCSLMATLFAAFQQLSLAAILTAVGGSINALGRQHAWQQRLAAVNEAIASISQMLQMWTRWDPLARRSLSNIDDVVMATEKGLMQVTNAHTGGAVASPDTRGGKGDADRSAS